MSLDMRIATLEDQAKQAIPGLLSGVLERGVGPSIARDGWIEMRVDEPPATLAIVPARESRRSLVLDAARRAQRYAGEVIGGLPTVVVPHMTPAGIEAAESVGVGWFDLAGNAHLMAPGILLHVEGVPANIRRPGRPASAFAPRSARVARAMLVEPERHWTQKELIDATALAQGMVSRTLSRLTDLRLVDQDDQGRYWVPSPGDLIEAWRDEYDYRRNEIVPAHMTGSGIGLARDLVGRLRSAEVGCALTGLPAAWLCDGFAQFRLVSVFVEGSPLRAAELAGLRVGEQGANVHLIRPAEDGVYYGSREIDGVRCVHPVQTYLDLSGLPERAAEAAEHLRQACLEY
jgi:DNA-binding transcriptional ArsR family regulator